MTYSTPAARRANASYTLSEAVASPTVSGTAVLYPTSSTTPVTVTLGANQTFRIISKDTDINYSLKRTSWSFGDHHRAAYLPSGLYELFHTTDLMTTLGVTLASGETTGTDVYITQMITSDTTNSYLSLDLLGL